MHHIINRHFCLISDRHGHCDCSFQPRFWSPKNLIMSDSPDYCATIKYYNIVCASTCYVLYILYAHLLTKHFFLTEEMATEAALPSSRGGGQLFLCCPWIAALCRLRQQQLPLLFPAVPTRVPPSRRKCFHLNSQVAKKARGNVNISAIGSFWDFKKNRK